MFFRQLKYFNAVAQAGSFTKAAERINVSQPALGLQVKKLEEELGVSLFIRHSRGVELTDNGKTLLGFANDIIDKVEEAKQAIIDVSGNISGGIHVGITPTMGRHLLHPILEACSEQFPDLQLSFTKGYSDELHQALLTDELNLAFSYDSSSGDKLIMNALLTDQFYLVGHKDLIGQEEEIDFSNLGQYPLVSEKRQHRTHELLREQASSLGISLNTVMEVDAIDIHREFLVNHARCAVVPYALFSTEIESGQLGARRIVNPLFERTLYLLKRRGSSQQLAETAVAGVITDIVESTITKGKLRWQRPPAK